MFFKSTFIALLTISALPAMAQVDSEGMSDISAWGERYLETGETEFPTNLWSGSDDATLLELLKSATASNLTPAERTLMRRVILSPTRKPTGDRAEALLAERARLMLELGEARAAAALAPRLQQDARGLDAETLAVDLDMASGREATACGRLSGPVPEGAYWAKLRAVCAVLQENYSGAELAVEVATAQGLKDDWFVEAIFAASGDGPKPPNARFDTGLNIALSAKVDLDTSRITMAGSRPDLAAAAARREGVPTDLRARFAEIAAQNGLISPQERRDILIARLEDPEHTASSNLEQTLQTLRDPLLDSIEKADRLHQTLGTYRKNDLGTFRAVSQLFLSDIEALPRNAETATYALQFARAALAAGDNDLAHGWLSATDYEGIEPIDPFDLAVLEALHLVTSGDKSRASQSAIQSRLLEAAESKAQKAYAANILTLWAGFDLPLTSDVRAFLREQEASGKRLSPYTVLTIAAAARSGAIGETALLTLDQTRGKPEQIASVDLAALIDALRQIDADDIAAQLALEASGFWKD